MFEKEIFKNICLLEKKIISHAKILGEDPEIEFDLKSTVSYVFNELKRIGLQPRLCGKAGVECSICGRKNGSVFLLRADMDALKIENSEKMHLCGHHFHTAMLLGAAEFLFKNNDKFDGTVKLMFQGAEEILEGSKDMIDNGVLDNPVPDGALMMHVISGVDMPLGKIIVSNEGISAPSADFFSVEIKGKGAHGALAHMGIDPISISAYVISSLNQIRARELGIGESGVLSIGCIRGGEVANVIPEKVVFEGTLRAFDENVREKIKSRLCEISNGIASAFKAQADVRFTRGCPTLKNDAYLSSMTFNSLKSILGENSVIMSDSDSVSKMSGGSDDFSYISQRIPSIAISLCAGSISDGFLYPLHNPKVRFDERALVIGATAYAAVAIEFLKKQGATK